LRKGNRLECLEALLLFSLPLLFELYFFVAGFHSEVLAHYTTYTVYIIGSILLTKYNGRPLADIGLTRNGFLRSLIFSMTLVVANLLGRLVSADPKFSSDVNSSIVFVNALFYWMFGGFGQEILFRGLILSTFQRWKGWKVALLISSILFGLVHIRQGFTGIIATIIIGGYWGWVALETKNIIGISIAHGLFNFLFNFLLVS
jgi:membrane protease YdiL (CAAX protease family)